MIGRQVNPTRLTSDKDAARQLRFKVETCANTHTHEWDAVSARRTERESERDKVCLCATHCALVMGKSAVL